MFRNTSHVFHFIMFMLTAGLWTPIWAWRVWANRRYNQNIVAMLTRPQNITVNTHQHVGAQMGPQ